MTFPRIGRKVRFHDLQRVDRPDIDAMSDLAAETTSDALAGIIGDIEPDATGGSAPRRYTAQNGLASPLDYSAAGKIVTFGVMRVGWLVEETPAPYATLATYDPADPGATPSLDFSGYDGLTPFVWARRVVADTETAPRRFWNEAGSNEETRAETTRTRASVQLGISLPTAPDDPPKGTGWARIARALTVPVSGDVELEPRHLFDRYDATFEGDTAVGQRAKYYAENRTSPGVGLNDAMTAIFATLSKIRDGRWVFDPETFKIDASMPVDLQGWRDLLDDPTAVGLAQLEDAAALRADVWAAIRGNLATQPQVLATYNAYKLGESGEGFVKNDPYCGLQVTTEGVSGARTWNFEIASVIRQIYDNQITVANHRIYGVRAVPFHTGNWVANNRGRVADIQVYRDAAYTVIADLPSIIDGGFGTNALYAKVRFRKVTIDDDTLAGAIEEPDYGFYFEVIGTPIF